MQAVFAVAAAALFVPVLFHTTNVPEALASDASPGARPRGTRCSARRAACWAAQGGAGAGTMWRSIVRSGRGVLPGAGALLRGGPDPCVSHAKRLSRAPLAQAAHPQAPLQGGCPLFGSVRGASSPDAREARTSSASGAGRRAPGPARAGPSAPPPRARRHLVRGQAAAAGLLRVRGDGGPVLAVHDEDAQPARAGGDALHDHQLLPHPAQPVRLRRALQCAAPPRPPALVLSNVRAGPCGRRARQRRPGGSAVGGTARAASRIARPSRHCLPGSNELRMCMPDVGHTCWAARTARVQRCDRRQPRRRRAPTRNPAGGAQRRRRRADRRPQRARARPRRPRAPPPAPAWPPA